MIAIVTAMDVELENILSRMENVQEVRRPGLFGCVRFCGGLVLPKMGRRLCRMLVYGFHRGGKIKRQ